MVNNRGDAGSLVLNLLNNVIRLLFGPIGYFTYAKNLLLLDIEPFSCDVENIEKGRMTANTVQGKETDEGSIVIPPCGHVPTIACRSYINYSSMNLEYAALFTAVLWDFIGYLYGLQQRQHQIVVPLWTWEMDNPYVLTPFAYVSWFICHSKTRVLGSDVIQNVKTAGEATYGRFSWNQRLIDDQQTPRKVSEWNLQFEQIAIGDETGIRGR
ncbi:hypothetical protein BDV38DRAFT_280607 [Aspergillus pseudotamarii]|uniref:Uncharacterized protein n=1 Tax=Aspergillus pseudotamarii TaxID=132259 RepID=A0A5N6T1J9_ASPPS|nr:uncharacterized protein BDV38DRAFT_280607 [Aspergillus pseudotamarii]KAE8140143.1 hypothetical protein BDV38DRAFT_280607 [Aspergillus pseudotamarii]